MRIEHKTLEIESPLVQCGHCRFATGLKGAWSVEDGRLVFRAAADPLRGRGPDYDSCGESDPVIEFERVTVDGEPLADEQVAQLRRTAQEASEAEMRSWEAVGPPR